MAVCERISMLDPDLQKRVREAPVYPLGSSLLVLEACEKIQDERHMQRAKELAREFFKNYTTQRKPDGDPTEPVYGFADFRNFA